MKEIDITKSAYTLVQENPEFKQVLVDVGFTPLNDSKMLNTVGRMVSPKDGVRQIGITVDELKQRLEEKGYQVKE